MSKSAGSTKTVSSSAPATFQQPYIDSLLSEAQRLYQSSGPGFYPGSTVAPFTSRERAGQESLIGASGMVSGTLADSLMPALQTGLGAADVENNPYLARAAEGAIRPVFQALTEQALPALRSTAIGTGNLGSSKYDLAGAQATERATRAALDTTSSMYSNAYNTGLDSVSRSLSLAPGLLNMAYQPGEMLSGIGGQERALNQAGINEQIARYTYEQQLPFQKLIEYSNLASRPFGGTGESSVTAEGGPGAAENTIGGILALLGSVPGLSDWIKGLFP